MSGQTRDQLERSGFATRLRPGDVEISHSLREQIGPQPQIEVEGEVEVQWDRCDNLVGPSI